MEKREICIKCDSPLSRCVCSIIQSQLSYPFPILVLQHPNEKNHYLNTVKILKLSLNNIEVKVAEKFDDEILDKKRKWFVLFPELDQTDIVKNKIKDSFNPQKDGIIIIDGTWKKAKKIYYLNSFLHTLPKLSLNNKYESQYELRTCSKENRLSTLEAFTYMMDEIKIATNENSILRRRMKEMIEKQKRLSL